MVEPVGNALPYTTAALFVAALLLFALAFRLFRRSRKDTYWRQRRDAGQRGLRAFLTAFVLLLASAVTCLFTVLAVLIDDKNAADPAFVPTTEIAAVTDSTGQAVPETITITADSITATHTPSEAIETPTPEPPTQTPAGTATPVVVVVTATPQTTPTQTPFPTFTPVMTAPAQSPVAPNPNASIQITALDDRISDTLEPVNPRTTFIAGTRRIYFFVLFDDMSPGVQWKRELYLDQDLINENRYPWGLESSGTTYFFFGSNEGFTPGEYEIRLYINDAEEPVSTNEFTVLPAPE